MTTVGYGDITPITNWEKLFTMLSQLASCAVFAYVVGSIETIVKNSSSIESDFKQKILHVSQFMKEFDIPDNIKQQVRRYLEHLQSHRKT